MQFLYNIFTYSYALAFSLAAFFMPKAKKAVEGRRDWERKLKLTIDPQDSWIWMHCSSLGEFEQGRPVFEALKEKYPHHRFALSFFSPSGFEVRKHYKHADIVFYLPLDTPKNAKKLAQILQPKLWILAKYDYWYNHLRYQHLQKTPIIVISAIFRPSQIYFKPYGQWFAQALKRYINHFFVQENQSKTLLAHIGISQATVAGDTRLDRVKTIARHVPTLDWLNEFKGNSKLIVIGSSWKEDEDLWISLINKSLPLDWKIVLAPHEIDAIKIQQFCSAVNRKTITYSELSKNHNISTDAQVLVVDTIGLLSKIYAYADIAYVGGGFNKSGVHNTLEPAVFGVPVIIGPNYQKFKEVIHLKEAGVVFTISQYDELEQRVLGLVQSPEKRLNIKAKATNYFNSQLPSTQIIVDSIDLT